MGKIKIDKTDDGKTFAYYFLPKEKRDEIKSTVVNLLPVSDNEKDQLMKADNLFLVAEEIPLTS